MQQWAIHGRGRLMINLLPALLVVGIIVFALTRVLPGVADRPNAAASASRALLQPAAGAPGGLTTDDPAAADGRAPAAIAADLRDAILAYQKALAQAVGDSRGKDAAEQAARTLRETQRKGALDLGAQTTPDADLVRWALSLTEQALDSNAPADLERALRYLSAVPHAN